MSTSPYFSIITPSLNMLNYLQICNNSISDQNVEFEHIVVDGLSQDGTIEWLEKRPDIRNICEKDQGMYDAINKGIRISNGEIISYLNCDEQYLPGALKSVKEIFLENPEIDILFGNTLIVNPNGKLITFRKGFIPRWPYVWASYLYVQSSSMFIRRNIFNSGIFFNHKWKTVGDSEFVVTVLRKGYTAKHTGQYLSAFTITGSNLGTGDLAMTEIKSFRSQAPIWLRYSTLLTNALIRFEKVLHRAYWEKFPETYSVFTQSNPNQRKSFKAESASALYPK